MVQPFLFEELNFPKDTRTCTCNLQKGGLSLIQKLYKLRRGLTEDERDLENYLNSAIKEIKSHTQLSSTQIEELILISIEKNFARKSEEISGDTRIPVPIVKKTILELVRKNVVRLVQYHVVGSDRKQYFIKSNRIPDDVEAI